VTELPAKQDSTAIFVVLAAWIVPGMGHLLLRRWGRAIVFFIAVGGLAVTGYFLRGNIFAARGGDAFGTLGFLADAGSGVFYFCARFFEAAGPDVSRAAGDYGTRFIAAAGVVNLISVCDAYEIVTRRRN
jgi:predicted membrane channel-forming protein YqfA (hemolysin III family)